MRNPTAKNLGRCFERLWHDWGLHLCFPWNSCDILGYKSCGLPQRGCIQRGRIRGCCNSFILRLSAIFGVPVCVCLRLGVFFVQGACKVCLSAFAGVCLRLSAAVCVCKQPLLHSTPSWYSQFSSPKFCSRNFWDQKSSAVLSRQEARRPPPNFAFKKFASPRFTLNNSIRSERSSQKIHVALSLGHFADIDRRWW